MTFRDIVGAMLRCWYLCLVVLATFAAVGWNSDKDSGSFVTNTVVTFTKPATAALEPDNGISDPSVISFASAIASEVNDGHTTPLYASADAPIYGAGVRQGISISVPNVGGQWSTSFTTAEIDVQIVGRAPEWVEQQQRTILARIAAATTAQQSATSPTGHISATIEPLSTQIGHIQTSRSSRLMAFAAIGLAGLISASATSVLLDGLLQYVRGRRNARRGRRLATGPVIGVIS